MTQTKQTIKTKKQIIEKSENIDFCDLKNIIKVLTKKAMGYSVKEIIEEFSMVDGNLELIKRKVSTKYYPPDITALNLILDRININNNFEEMTDEELEEEKNLLIEKLNLIKEEANGN